MPDEVSGEPAHGPFTVVQVLPALESGGVERGTLEVADALARTGHRSIVISAGGRLVAPLVRAGSEHVRLDIGRKSPLTLRHARTVRRLLVERSVDVLHARSRMPAWVAWRAWRGLPATARTRFVTTVHGLHSVSWYSAVMTRGERVIVGSKTVEDYVTTRYPGVDGRRLVRIPRGVDRAAFPHGYRPSAEWLEAWYARYPELRGRRVLTLPGRITRLKGHHDLVALVDRIADEDVHVLVVGGEDPRRRRYAAEVRRAAAGRPVTFTGHRDDVRDVYAVSDVVLSLSSRPESFGRTALEALSLGVPVVGYDHGGVGEILAALFPAGRVPLGDIEALAERVCAVLAGAPEIPREHPYTLEAMTTATLDVYGDLVAGDGR